MIRISYSLFLNVQEAELSDQLLDPDVPTLASQDKLKVSPKGLPFVIRGSKLEQRIRFIANLRSKAIAAMQKQARNTVFLICMVLHVHSLPRDPIPHICSGARSYYSRLEAMASRLEAITINSKKQPAATQGGTGQRLAEDKSPLIINHANHSQKGIGAISLAFMQVSLEDPRQRTPIYLYTAKLTPQTILNQSGP